MNIDLERFADLEAKAQSAGDIARAAGKRYREARNELADADAELYRTRRRRRDGGGEVVYRSSAFRHKEARRRLDLAAAARDEASERSNQLGNLVERLRSFLKEHGLIRDGRLVRGATDWVEAPEPHSETYAGRPVELVPKETRISEPHGVGPPTIGASLDIARREFDTRQSELALEGDAE